ncbi:class I SAM-dependent methyltransferase [Tenggerimyces flavus]|uniref:Methyltransferase domain-containing protein n=1 Tax=Tenggerimyces flavus TaxID=1708749 RepID=A0ABV7YFF2_9ACTN|nr:class I SAM-dependent methyltransferase [Tenggerimyces flavus]MBM7784525.1 SAM-dependent methyltransferase [Tenggerimyces flavus]
MARRYADLLADLRTAYDGGASQRDQLSKYPWKVEERAAFLARLREAGSQRLLEIGAGTGQDSVFFTEHGLSVVAIDLSPAMVARCVEKGLDARVLDFTGLTSEFPAASFDAVWSMNCLQHVPTADLPPIVAQIRAMLRPGGLFYFGSWGGDGTEGLLEDDSHTPPRFFAWRTLAQLESALADSFTVVDTHTVFPGTRNPFHALTARAK